MFFLYLDISLYLQRNDETPEKISNPGGSVTIALKLEDSMIADDREYYIIYVHNGGVKTLDASFDKASKTLTFDASEFSSYAIAYRSAKRPDADYDYVPGTGNTTGLEVWTGLLLFLGVVVTHQYSVLKAIVIAVVTLLGMCIIVYIMLLFLNLIQQILGFALTFWRELSLRLT